MSPAEIEQAVSTKTFTAWSFASGNAVAFAVAGLILAALVSLFTRRRRTRHGAPQGQAESQPTVESWPSTA